MNINENKISKCTLEKVFNGNSKEVVKNILFLNNLMHLLKIKSKLCTFSFEQVLKAWISIL